MVVLFILSFMVMFVVPVMRKFFLNIDTVYALLHFSLLECVYFIRILLYKNRRVYYFVKLFSERLLLAGASLVLAGIYGSFGIEKISMLFLMAYLFIVLKYKSPIVLDNTIIAFLEKSLFHFI